MIYNGTTDPDDFRRGDWKAARELLIAVWRAVEREGSRCSSWWGTLDDAHVPETLQNKGPGYLRPRWWPEDIDRQIPWFTLWEYCYVLTRASLAAREGLHLLSLGGAASMLDLCCMRLGHRVTVLDARTYGVERQQRNAKLLGVDNLLCGYPGRPIENMHLLDGQVFDGMVSTNVIFLAGEAAQRACREKLFELIRPDGFACFTFDVGNPNPKRLVTDPVSHFKWHGFEIDGEWIDNGQRYHFYYPEPMRGYYTAGGMLLRRMP
jgi:hypothetical protein